jgi:hypothetical protein
MCGRACLLGQENGGSLLFSLPLLDTESGVYSAKAELPDEQLLTLGAPARILPPPSDTSKGFWGVDKAAGERGSGGLIY